MRTIAAFVALAIAVCGVGCKKKSPPTESSSATATAVVEECRPGACSEKCPCGARQKCVVGVCGYDPAYHIRQIVLGAGTFGCALYENGEVWCAGKNVVGQLGNGKAPVGPSAADEGPAKVVGIGKANEIVAGVFHACALVSGSVWCWGLNGSGELGTRVDIPGVGQQTGTPVKVNHLDDAVRIAAGNSHSCAIKRDHSVVCWGGHPGEGLTEKAGARAIKGLANVRDLALNLQSSCALRTDGTVACWGVDGPIVNVPSIKNAQNIARTQFSTCIAVGGASLSTSDVRCWGGRFGVVPVDVPYLANTNMLSAGTDLVCGATVGARELRCSDTKTNYRVTVGDSGAPVAARLLAVSGAWTANVHFGGDVVDADDDHPSKAVLDMLGSGSLPQAEGLAPPQPTPAVATAVPSCDGRPFSGTCVEYTNGSAGSDARTRCHDEKGKWSDEAACPRETAYGTCVIGSKLDRGATMIIYASQYTKSQTDARAMCKGGFDGSFTPL